MSVEQAKPQIEGYLRERFKKEKQAYPSDIADILGLSYEVVREVFDELEQEGKILCADKRHV